MKHGKIAVLGPSFFGYMQAIRTKLAQRGVESEFFDERYGNTPLVKLLYRARFYSVFPGRKRRHLDGICARIRAGSFTAVLLISPQVCDRRCVQQLSDAGIPIYLYMWDSTRNNPGYLDYVDLLRGRASFEPEDCSTLGMTYIPLFAEDVYSALHDPLREQVRSVDISFCGTLHSNRARRLGELLNVARRTGLRVSLLLYFHSRWLLLFMSCVRFSNARFLRLVSTAGFSKEQIRELFGRSKFVFDLSHPGQAGLTARTFETLRSGTRLITFNKAARSMLPGSLADRISIIDKISDVITLDFSSSCPSAILTEADDYYLSLDRFVDQILDLIAT